MPELSAFLEGAENTRALTVTLSGESRALLFSAIATITSWRQWTKAGGLDDADKDTIDALISEALHELQTEVATMPAGVIVPYAGGTIPTGWFLCDGSVKISTAAPDLFAAIGTTYNVGGEPANGFRVPDLRGRTVVGVGQGSGLTNRALAATGGQETHTLVIAEIPAHDHSYQHDTGNISAGTQTGQGRDNVLSNFVTGSAGGGGAHNNMQPFMALNYIIKAEN